MEERQLRAGQVMDEVADKWSGPQTLAGPVLVIPIVKQEKIDKGKDGVEIREVVEMAFFLPGNLSVKGTINPQVLHRGIFDAIVYESSIALMATFPEPDFKSLNIAPDKILWQDARLIFGLSDLRGISDNPQLTVGGKALSSEPSNDLGVWLNGSRASSSAEPAPQKISTSTGIVSKLGWQRAEDFQGSVSLTLPLKGSSQLYFVPLGKTTDVNLSGPWPDPSFDGEFLPSERTLSEKNFEATWKVLHYNRPFSQQWIGAGESLAGYEFGVKLIIPVDQYQKSIRTSKYGILLVLLTFIALFMVEIMNKIRIHPFQYILIGSALIIYYTLLLSLSEHLGYNVAYLLSTLATLLLVTLYSSSFLLQRKITMLFSALLAFFYGFIFVIIQLQDYSLLLGSFGLFMIVAALMYFSRNISWYGKSNESAH
jgi:inner membrane protein